jgi:hypothetical protein
VKKRPDRRFWHISVFLTYLIVQVGVPAILLTGPRPSRFGWQMFAGVRSLDVYSVVRHDASTVPISREAFFGNPRAEMEIDVPRLVLRICERRTDAIAVRVKNAMTGHIQDHPCGRE